jgi:tRNA(Ile)-lysidine synthase
MRDEVLRYIRRSDLIKAGDRLLVAVSGGADSVALLRLLLELRSELGIVLAVAHFNHLLRGQNSDADEHFVADLATHFDLPIHVERKRAAESAQGVGVESASRTLRYEWLIGIAIENRFDAVATAHTLDDQAETVLMKFLRGTGTKGLAGIYPELYRGEVKKVRLLRPLLETTRAHVEAYLTSLDQPWREDESNLDHRFRRNRVRHELLPLLERDYNPSVRRVLSDVAEINRAEEEYWGSLTEAALRRVRIGPERLRRREFADLELALQRRVLKSFLDQLNITSDFHHIEALRQCALAGSSQTELTEGWMARREADVLIVGHSERQPTRLGYSYKLTVPGEIQIPEIGCLLRAIPVPANFADEAEPGTLLKADLIGPELWVRNWHAGDRFHVSYMGREHKLKDLFWEWKIPAAERPQWPVALKDIDIVWVRQMHASDTYCWRPGNGSAIRIDCVKLAGTV